MTIQACTKFQEAISKRTQVRERTIFATGRNKYGHELALLKAGWPKIELGQDIMTMNKYTKFQEAISKRTPVKVQTSFVTGLNQYGCQLAILKVG